MKNRAPSSTFGFRHSFVIRHSCFVIPPRSSFVLLHSSNGNPSFHNRSREVRGAALPCHRRVRRGASRSSSRHLHLGTACPFRRWNSGRCYLRSASGQGFTARESAASHHFHAAQDRVDSHSRGRASLNNSFRQEFRPDRGGKFRCAIDGEREAAVRNLCRPRMVVRKKSGWQSRSSAQARWPASLQRRRNPTDESERSVRKQHSQ